METIDKSIIKSTTEYKLALLKKLLKELNERRNSFYYSYHPAGSKQHEFHTTPEKIRILDGVNRTGKSVTAFQDMYMFMAGDHPMQSQLKMPVPNLWWVVVSSFKKVTESGGLWEEKVLKQIPMNLVDKSKFVFRKEKNEYECKFKNGSGFTFISQEQGADAFKSAAINGFLCDERVKDETIRGQLRMRIFDKGGIGIFNMDLLSPDEWIEELTLKGMAKQWTLGVDDNKFLAQEEKERLYKELNEASKFVLLSGKRANPDESLLFLECWNDESYSEVNPSRYTVDFRIGHLIEDKGGLLRVFSEKNPQSTYYVIVDSATGVGHDETVIDIFNDECDQVACWHSKDTKIFDQKHTIAFLSKYYNNALIVIENNGSSGIALINGLSEMDVPLYSQYDVIDGKVRNVEVGIKTEKNNKAERVLNTQEDLSKGWIHLHYWVTKEQLTNFGINKEGKYKGLKKSYWREGRGYLESEKDGERIGEDDHSMAVIIADTILREQGHIGKVHAKRIMTIDEQKKRNQNKDMICINGIPIGTDVTKFHTY